jgi:cyclopropane-fatty-acyl-phospholipid synthase
LGSAGGEDIVFWERPIDHALSRLKRDVRAPLRVELWDGRGFDLSDEAPRATLRLKGPRAAATLAKPSLLALAEAYIEGEAELEGDLREAIRSAEAISRTRSARTFDDRGPAGVRRTRDADRAAIRHHYDVSNEFYALWLDPGMVYSCAYFRTAADSLEQAQVAKLDHVCTKLRLAPGDRFLDIGCGWGALAMRAAERYGVEATGITLSENQFRLAEERIRAAGLQGRCRVLLQDYREHKGEGIYDKVASVGMFEHVGLQNLPAYFGTVRRLLRDRGLFLNHGITSSDVSSRAVGLGAGEFIDRYVFPKGELPHLHRAIAEMSAADLEVSDVEGLRPHYVRTLELWSAAFERNLAAAVAVSSERTARIWRLYLAGCAHAFEQGWVSIYQVLASKQEKPGRSELPMTREWMYRR